MADGFGLGRLPNCSPLFHGRLDCVLLWVLLVDEGESGTNLNINAVFYNVYLVSETSEELLHEQMKQIQDALATNSSSNNKKTVLYYNVIGYNYTKSICDSDGPLVCKRLKYYKQAHEDVTLQPLHE